MKKKHLGFGLRLTFAIIMLLGGIAVFVAPIPDIIYKIVLGAVLLVTGILGFICAFVGRTKKWANTLSIVIGSIFVIAYLLGLFALIGGIRGRRQLKREQAEQVELPSPDYEPQAEGAVSAPASAKVNTNAQYIQSQTGIKGKKSLMIVTIISYALLLIAGIVLSAIPSFGATVNTVGVMWCALVPGIGYYFATVSPCKISKNGKIILATVTTVLLIIMDVVFFVIINTVCAEVTIDGITTTSKLKDCFDGDDKWFIPMSMIFASLGLAVCHALTLFRLNPEKIANAKPEQDGDGFMSVIKHVFALLFYGVLGLVKFLLSFKEKQPDIFIIVSTILLTWLAFFTSFVFAIICIAIFVIIIILCFSGLVSFCYIPTNYEQTEESPTDQYYKEDEFTYIDETGHERTVYSNNGKDFYDVGGHYQFSGRIKNDKVIIDIPVKYEEDED